MFDTKKYWAKRYRTGGNSGRGSQGDRVQWKADLINLWTVGSLLDIGCGDGELASRLTVKGWNYTGVDVTAEAVTIAETRCSSAHKFYLLSYFEPKPHDTHMSMDVIYHLVDDRDYEEHMRMLFMAEQRVLIMSSNVNKRGARHVRHRRFTDDVPEDWKLMKVELGADWSLADFYVYDKKDNNDE